MKSLLVNATRRKAQPADSTVLISNCFFYYYQNVVVFFIIYNNTNLNYFYYIKYIILTPVWFNSGRQAHSNIILNAYCKMMPFDSFLLLLFSFICVFFQNFLAISDFKTITHGFNLICFVLFSSYFFILLGMWYFPLSIYTICSLQYFFFQRSK